MRECHEVGVEEVVMLRPRQVSESSLTTNHTENKLQRIRICHFIRWDGS